MSDTWQQDYARIGESVVQRLTNLPLPIAHVCSRLLASIEEGSSPIAAVWYVRDALECCIRYATCILLAENISLSGDRRLLEAIAPVLGKPRGVSLGDWAAICRNLLFATHDKDLALRAAFGHSFVIGRSRLSPLGSKLLGDAGFVPWRNRTFGHGILAQDIADLLTTGFHWLCALEETTAAITTAGEGWSLLDGTPAMRVLHGLTFAHPDDHLPSGAAVSARLRSTGGRDFACAGLISVQTCTLCNQNHVFFFDRMQLTKSGNRSWFLDFEKGHLVDRKDTALLAPLVDALPKTFEWTRSGIDKGEIEAFDAALFSTFDSEYRRPDWLLDDLINAIEKLETGYVVLCGPAGIGKSFALRGLQKEFQNSQLTPLFYAITSGVASDYRTFIALLADEVRARLGVFTQEIQTAAAKTLPELRREFESFLRTIIDHNLIPGLILIIDGVDQIDEPDDRTPTILDILPDPKDLPKGARVVLGVRPTMSTRVRRRMSEIRNREQPFLQLEFDVSDNGYARLLRAYATDRIAEANANIEIIDTILERAGGSFLYLYQIVLALSTGLLKAKAVLPEGRDVSAALLREIRRLVGDRVFTELHLPLLVTLITAAEPMRLEDLNTIGRSEEALAMALLDLRYFVRREVVTTMVDHILGARGVHRFVPAHASIVETLEHSESYAGILQNSHGDRARTAYRRYAPTHWNGDSSDPQFLYDVAYTIHHARCAKNELLLTSIINTHGLLPNLRVIYLALLRRKHFAEALKLAQEAFEIGSMKDGMRPSGRAGPFAMYQSVEMAQMCIAIGDVDGSKKILRSVLEDSASSVPTVHKADGVGDDWFVTFYFVATLNLAFLCFTSDGPLSALNVLNRYSRRLSRLLRENGQDRVKAFTLLARLAKAKHEIYRNLGKVNRSQYFLHKYLRLMTDASELGSNPPRGNAWFENTYEESEAFGYAEFDDGHGHYLRLTKKLGTVSSDLSGNPKTELEDLILKLKTIYALSLGNFWVLRSALSSLIHPSAADFDLSSAVARSPLRFAAGFHLFSLIELQSGHPSNALQLQKQALKLATSITSLAKREGSHLSDLILWIKASLLHIVEHMGLESEAEVLRADFLEHGVRTDQFDDLFVFPSFFFPETTTWSVNSFLQSREEYNLADPCASQHKSTLLALLGHEADNPEDQAASADDKSHAEDEKLPPYLTDDASKALYRMVTSRSKIASDASELPLLDWWSADGHRKFANGLWDRNLRQEASYEFERTIDILTKLVAGYGFTFCRRSLACCQAEYAVLLADMGKQTEALELIDCSIETLDQMIRVEGRVRLRQDLAQLLMWAAPSLEIALKTETAERRGQWYQSAFEHIWSHAVEAQNLETATAAISIGYRAMEAYPRSACQQAITLGTFLLDGQETARAGGLFLSRNALVGLNYYLGQALFSSERYDEAASALGASAQAWLQPRQEGEEEIGVVWRNVALARRAVCLLLAGRADDSILTCEEWGLDLSVDSTQAIIQPLAGWMVATMRGNKEDSLVLARELAARIEVEHSSDRPSSARSASLLYDLLGWGVGVASNDELSRHCYERAEWWRGVAERGAAGNDRTVEGQE